tara:strand:- start:228 stop:2183 length:1956 start_codon:yes stop_codon:yes gene_type:complete
MKRSEYKKLLLEFMSLNEDDKLSEVDLSNSHWYYNDDTKDLMYNPKQPPANYFPTTKAKKIGDNMEITYSDPNESSSYSDTIIDAGKEGMLERIKEVIAEESGQGIDGEALFGKKFNVQAPIPGFASNLYADAEMGVVMSDGSVIISDEDNNDILKLSPSEVPPALYDFIKGPKSGPSPTAATTAKKKSLSKSATDSIKEIQKIIKAPSSEDGANLGDGTWGKNTQAAFVNYLSANSEALNGEGIDDPSKFASDATYMKEKLGELGHPKNVKGVLALLQSLETKEDGETTSATSKDDNVYVVEDNFRNKYYKDENNDFYYVDADGRYVYKDTLKYEAFGTDPFASFNSEDKIRVPGQVEGTTVEVSKWGNTVDKIHYKEWTEITEEEAEVLANKEEAAAPAAAPSPDNAKSKTRRETRRETRKDRKRARLQNRLNRLQETNMNEKLINEMKKGKASLLNLLNEQVPEKMDKPEGGGETPKQKPEKKKGWDYYVSVGKTTDDKEQRRTLANLWKNISGKTEYAKDSIEVLSYDDSIYPGDFGSDLKDFSAWYKKVLPLEIKNGDGEVIKEKGANFNVEESNKIILLLLADAGATPKTIAGFRIPSETLAVFKDALQMIQNDQGSTKAATTKEKIEESLSRGSLYRRRYHGRY